MAYHDGLTRLPNRSAFSQSLAQMIDACQGDGSEFAVISVDIDRFKEINDVFGHAFGDKLLSEVARAIQIASQGALVARLSGDEFGLIIDGPQPESGRVLAERIRDAMRDEFQIDGKELRVGLTCGISLYPRDGNDPTSLLANADVALYRAKAEARGSVRVFEPEMDQQTRDRRALHLDLSHAIENHQLSLYYQPLVRAGDDGNVTGFEALVRWHHPMRGFVSPGVFIPIAEESGLIMEMGEWVLREACREASSWPKPIQVAVNLSPVQFMHGDLVGLVHSILLETGLSPGRLELEVTEGVLIRDFDRGVALLRRLKGLGVRISMDDFGTGYSSLSYLQSFPFDKIKIDRAFVKHIGRNAQSGAIIRAIVNLGHGLNVPIVAEGVETPEQRAFLIDARCDQLQGFLLGKPEPIIHYAEIVGREKPVEQPMPIARVG
jgi:diguanylate cyclase (GGDEF)-like protein